MSNRIIKINNYYTVETEKGSYIFLEPIPNKLKIITLIIIRKLPMEIKAQILHNLIIESIKERFIYEKIIETFEEEEINLYYKEKYESDDL